MCITVPPDLALNLLLILAGVALGLAVPFLLWIGDDMLEKRRGGGGE
jgi:hypothetical protein